MPNSLRRHLLIAGAVLAAAPWAHAQGDTVKIGLILPMTGPFASTGRQIDAAVKLWRRRTATRPAARRSQVILKDDGGARHHAPHRAGARGQRQGDDPRRLRRHAAALATAPIATQSKTPMVVMAAATSVITEKSPFVVRAGFTLPQVTSPLANWAGRPASRRW